ncbi:MAG: hypothetical protein IJ963_05600 [Phascolarctobacterium sp.]|nr:hypothetical protein [Phascolarctobacterium sp.]MBR6636868.1 hypothetical protein [Phascolarctobacterium sp.]
MRNLETLNRYRLATNEIRICGTTGDSGNGIFLVRVKGKRYYVVASDGGGWDHVSVSPTNGKEVPSWEVMCKIKEMFFEDEEEVVQFHPRKSEYINLCKTCLHLWRPNDGREFAKPDVMMV